jgi:hypothetical protein
VVVLGRRRAHVADAWEWFDAGQQHPADQDATCLEVSPIERGV